MKISRLHQRSVIQFFNRIIKNLKEGKQPSEQTLMGQPWVKELIGDPTFKKMLCLNPEITLEISTPEVRISGARDSSGNKPSNKSVSVCLKSGDLAMRINFESYGQTIESSPVYFYYY